MGIDVCGLDFLMRNRRHIEGKKILELGRQGVHLMEPMGNAAITEKIFRRYDLETPIYPTCRVSHADEGLYAYLGAESVDSMDISSYERCTILHDLNNPVPEELHNKYDTIIEAGTIEHIYDTKMVFDNIKKMLKVGGTFLCLTNANNFVNHGFYQFSPELFRTVFSVDAGYLIESLQLMHVNEEVQGVDVADTSGTRTPIRLNGVEWETYLMMVATKMTEEVITKNFQQSDYITIWGPTYDAG